MCTDTYVYAQTLTLIYAYKFRLMFVCLYACLHVYILIAYIALDSHRWYSYAKYNYSILICTILTEKIWNQMRLKPMSCANWVSALPM